MGCPTQTHTNKHPKRGEACMTETQASPKPIRVQVLTEKTSWTVFVKQQPRTSNLVRGIAYFSLEVRGSELVSLHFFNLLSTVISFLFRCPPSLLRIVAIFSLVLLLFSSSCFFFPFTPHFSVSYSGMLISVTSFPVLSVNSP